MENELYLLHHIARYLPLSDFINVIHLNKEIFKNRKVLMKLFDANDFDSTVKTKIVGNSDLLAKRTNTALAIIYPIYVVYTNLDMILNNKDVNKINAIMERFIDTYFTVYEYIEGFLRHEPNEEGLDMEVYNDAVKAGQLMEKGRYIIRYFKQLK